MRLANPSKMWEDAVIMFFQTLAAVNRDDLVGYTSILRRNKNLDPIGWLFQFDLKPE